MTIAVTIYERMKTPGKWTTLPVVVPKLSKAGTVFQKKDDREGRSGGKRSNHLSYRCTRKECTPMMTLWSSCCGHMGAAPGSQTARRGVNF